MQKPVSLQEDLYKLLKSMKPDKDRSFTFVIKSIIDENNTLKIENVKLKEENIKLLEESAEKKKRGFW